MSWAQILGLVKLSLSCQHVHHPMCLQSEGIRLDGAPIYKKLPNLATRWSLNQPYPLHCRCPPPGEAAVQLHRPYRDGHPVRAQKAAHPQRDLPIPPVQVSILQGSLPGMEFPPFSPPFYFAGFGIEISQILI